MGYQERDWEVVDYHMYGLEDTGLWFRGPRPSSLHRGDYFVCLGAAQTFGCFCEEPFPTLLQEKLKIRTLNLGYGGAGPYFFLNQRILPYINNAKFAIVQVMSGRSESNLLFDSGGLELLTRRSDGTKIGAQAAYQELLEKDDDWWNVSFGRVFGSSTKIPFLRKISAFSGRRALRNLVAETRQNWANNYRLLLGQIIVPTILFWFSKRGPDYKEKYTNVGSLFGEFPHLVNCNVLNKVKKYSDYYVECMSRRGSPQLLISRFTGKLTTIDPALDRKDLGGKLWTHNEYYPSPEMHLDAADVLERVCRDVIKATK